MNVLSKGLSFCPSTKPDWFELELDLTRFFRALKLRVWFGSNPRPITEPAETEHIPAFRLRDVDLYIPSDFVPNIQSNAIDAYIDAVKKDIKALRCSSENLRFSHPNMSKCEFEALDELVHNHDLTIKPADKGGGIVVMDTSQYIEEAMSQLRSV